MVTVQEDSALSYSTLEATLGPGHLIHLLELQCCCRQEKQKSYLKA